MYAILVPLIASLLLGLFIAVIDIKSPCKSRYVIISLYLAAIILTAILATVLYYVDSKHHINGVLNMWTPLAFFNCCLEFIILADGIISLHGIRGAILLSAPSLMITSILLTLSIIYTSRLEPIALIPVQATLVVFFTYTFLQFPSIAKQKQDIWTLKSVIFMEIVLCFATIGIASGTETPDYHHILTWVISFIPVPYFQFLNCLSTRKTLDLESGDSLADLTSRTASGSTNNE